MTALANERVAYFNGRIVPESEVLIPFRDRGFIFGDAVFDTARTFNHRPFRLKEHVERLQRSLRYLQIDSGHSVDELVAISEEVLARNLHLIDDDEDYWLTSGSAVAPTPATAWRATRRRPPSSSSARRCRSRRAPSISATGSRW